MNRTCRWLCCLVLTSCGGSGEPTSARGPVLTGSLPLYHMQGNGVRNDASGVAYLPRQKRALVIDDGGDAPPDVMPFYLVDVAANFGVSELASDLMKRHGDLEGATSDGTFVYLASSLSAEYKEERFHNLSRFRLQGDALVDATTIAPRAQIMETLRATFGADWFERVSGLDGKTGGLNVEGLTATPTPNQLLIGLRSPHVGDSFPQDLRSGLAIVVQADVSDLGRGLAGATAHTLDLGGLGIRSLEYSPTAKGYFIAAGPVETATAYELYFWKGPGSSPVRLELAEFRKLCRPEGVAEIEFDGKKYLWVISEQSGTPCDEVPYNFILVELESAFLASLK